MTSLHTKYRPIDFDDVVGQDEAVKALQAELSAGTQHSFIFTGPSGVGKTTIARILASKVGCDGINLMEIDAATHTGIDAMRSVTESLNYMPLSGSKSRVLIIDEAHALSRSAWDSLLKSIEEPPQHVYWCFCSTVPSKIPQTIRTRCSVYDLKPVHADDIYDLLVDVDGHEDAGTHEDVLDLISRRCEGSPRRALVWLSKCLGLKSAKEALYRINETDDQDDTVIALCRALAKGTTWKQAMKLVKPLHDRNPEGVRIVVTSYFSKAAADAKTDALAEKALAVLDAFAEPYPTTPGIYPLLLSLGRLLFD